ncbi:MAG TPA: hypothetical protein VF898_00420 [Chloroflexota bacterium]
MSRRFGRCLVVAALPFMTLLGLGAPTTLHAQAASLSGEELSNSAPGSYAFDFPCSSPGSYTVSFSVSGTATGPYPGTFTESGTLSYTINTPYGTSNSGTVTDFSATFVITSGKTIVIGSKALDPSGTPGTISCGRHSGTAGFIVSEVPTTYTAAIATRRSTSTDAGTSIVDMSWDYTFGDVNSDFDENF